jgi:hypothetical protein
MYTAFRRLDRSRLQTIGCYYANSFYLYFYNCYHLQRSESNAERFDHQASALPTTIPRYSKDHVLDTDRCYQ